MTLLRTETTRIQTEHQLNSKKTGFSEAYLAVKYLYLHLKNHPDSITKETALSLLRLIESDKFDKKKQAYFLYKEASEALIHISMDITHPLAGYALLELQSILLATTGRKHRAVSEALGSLPINIIGPDASPFNESNILHLSFDQFIEHTNQTVPDTMKWHGRTLRFKAKDGKIGCIKFANSKENIAELAMESHWLDFLNSHPPCPGAAFKIPEPIRIKNKFMFKFNNLPAIIISNNSIFNEYTAIVFIADKEYFHYPNDPDMFNDPASTTLQDVFKKNARLLGELTARGLVHTALIPLFHNRVQQSRRQDGGIYVWELGGRLDRWLESSMYPNFAASGIRDFEHMISIKNTRDVRHFIGEHILGFILVLGSFFRNKVPNKFGTDENGFPVDTRDQFDPSLFADVLKDVVEIYYESFTGFPLKKSDHFFNTSLVDDLIQSMGMDHYMEETLRIQDQQNMTNEDFYDFLLSRGQTLSMATNATKGEADIVLSTGPHLGGFNQPICVPQLVDFLFCLSSLCISDRYIMENRLKAFVN